jgi:hypothetical protein
MTTDAGTLDDVAGGSMLRGLGAVSLSRTKTMSSTRSTRQQAMGSSAGARSASPVRRLKQAWCRTQRNVSPTIQSSAVGR